MTAKRVCAREVYVIEAYNKVNKVQANNKVQKVQTLQLSVVFLISLLVYLTGSFCVKH